MILIVDDDEAARESLRFLLGCERLRDARARFGLVLAEPATPTAGSPMLICRE
jgi:hypothetical protein